MLDGHRADLHAGQRARGMGRVTLTRHGNVAVLTMESKETRNAISPAMGRQMQELCDEIDDDATIGAAVVRGAHGTFCSGADRRQWRPHADQTTDRTYKETTAVYSAFLRVGELCVPTIAAVRGAAVGAGLNLMLATDVRIVSADARIIGGFLRIGLHPGGGYFALSGRAMGREATAAMGLFDEEVDGLRAVEIGLAWEACDDASVESRALALASRAGRDPELARAAVRSFRTELEPPGVPWAVAAEYERATQMWSQRRRLLHKRLYGSSP